MQRAIFTIVAILSLIDLRAHNTAMAITPPPFIHEGPSAIDEQTTMLASPTRPFRIAILPDRTTGRDWGLPYLEAAVRDLNRMQPDAVFTIGDMVQGYTRNEQEWDREAVQWKKITDGLTMPLFPVAGNHDVISGSRVPGDRTFGDKYLRTFGPLRYMAELDGASVIALFSDETYGKGGVQLSDGQIGWLKTCLERAKTRGKPIILVMHRPLWRTESVKWFERVHPALVQAGVSAVIAGHFHSMQDDGVRDGVHYDIVGTCGGSIDQHPLAGQMQHLSFLQIQPNGKVKMFHQPVGVTLPSDFVLRVDQDAVFALREKPGSMSLQGTLPDPMQTDAPLEASIIMQIKNPLATPIEVDARLYTSPEPWIVDGEMFVSRTAIDAFNPFTIDAKTLYTLKSVGPITVKAGETAAITLHFSWPRALSPVAPPTIVVREIFTDSKARLVPVFMYQRPAIMRHIVLATGATNAPPTSAQSWPIHAWVGSPYDTLEPDPTVVVWTTPDHKTLCLRLQVTDQVTTSALPIKVDFNTRLSDPSSDAIAVLWQDNAGAAALLVEPFTPFIQCDRKGVDAKFTHGSDESGTWWAQIEIPLTNGLPTTLNVGVADNDEHYHTLWRWLAPAPFPAEIKALSHP